MGIFRYDLKKEGPGVDKSGNKKAFIRFLELYFLKFRDLLKLNLLFATALLICFIPAVFLYIGYGFTFNIVVAASVLLIAFAGPAIAGFTRIVRDYVRGDYAFIWSDFIEAAQMRWKRATAVTLVNILVLGIYAQIVPFYCHAIQTKGFLYIFPLAVAALVFAVYLFMQYYIYTLLITFDLKLKDLYKNALLLAILGLGRNMLVTIVIAGLAALFFYVPLASLLIPLIGLSTVGLLISFVTWPLIEEHMMDNEAKNEYTVESIFKDRGRQK